MRFCGRRGDAIASAQKKIVIIAGPNGAGKTTFADDYLADELHSLGFINADLIARGLSPFDPEEAAMEAGRIMLRTIARKVARGQSFAFETTLSGRAYAGHIRRWRAAGYQVKLIFLSLPSADTAMARVRTRVTEGGHDVPEAVVRRRFDLGLRNFNDLYLGLVSSWALYDNSGRAPLLISSGDNA